MQEEKTWKPALGGVTGAYVVAAQMTAVRVDEPDRKVGFDAEQMARFCGWPPVAACGTSSSCRNGLGSAGVPTSRRGRRRHRLGRGLDDSAPRLVHPELRHRTRPVADRGRVVPGIRHRRPSPDFIDVDDIAAVVVEALTAPGQDGKVYELSGPEALTGEQAASAIGRTLGRPSRTPTSRPTTGPASPRPGSARGLDRLGPDSRHRHARWLLPAAWRGPAGPRPAAAPVRRIRRASRCHGHVGA